MPLVEQHKGCLLSTYKWEVCRLLKVVLDKNRDFYLATRSPFLAVGDLRQNYDVECEMCSWQGMLGFHFFRVSFQPWAIFSQLHNLQRTSKSQGFTGSGTDRIFFFSELQKGTREEKDRWVSKDGDGESSAEAEEYLSAAFWHLIGNKSQQMSMGGVRFDVSVAWRKVSFHTLSGPRGVWVSSARGWMEEEITQEKSKREKAVSGGWGC